MLRAQSLSHPTEMYEKHFLQHEESIRHECVVIYQLVIITLG